MSKRRTPPPRTPPPRTPPSVSAAPPSERARPLLLAAATGLVTATPLIASETVQLGNGSLILMALWLVVLCGWTCHGAWRGRLVWHHPAGLLPLALLAGWMVLSAAVTASRGQPRAAWNMAWQWVTLGTLFLLVPQLAVTGVARRAWVAVMMGLAVALSMVGYSQYFVEQPAMLAAYRADPESQLREAGLVAPPGSPARAAFENRLASVEPFATFALANSLAGFLSAWLVVAWGLGLAHAQRGERRTRIVAGLTTVAVLGCWILTKSRSAYVATLVGAAVLAIYGRRAGWRPGWRLSVGGLAVVGALVIAAWQVRGLDALVISQAAKAMLYRVQYWQATLRLIGDYPWFGCGPGNFQQYYTAYKLPEASETVADPHNFLLEVGSSGGVPAGVLFLVTVAALAWRMVRGPRPETSAAQAPTGPAAQASAPGATPVYAGALGGILGGWLLCVLMEGYMPSVSLWLVGLPAGAAVVYGWHRWVIAGELGRLVPGVAALVLLINLSAAGGIAFAGVAGSLWLLAAVAVCEAGQGGKPHVLAPSRARVAALASLLVLALFIQTGCVPQMRARTQWLMAQARYAEGRADQGLALLRASAEADPLSDEGWQRLTASAWDAWLATGELPSEALFEQSLAQAVRTNPRSARLRQQAGDWWLGAFRRFGKSEYLDRAIEAYTIAVQLYPNYNFGHAQLAWSLHLAGRQEAASRAAAEALRLDAANPHTEQKLAQRQLYDPGAASATPPPPSAGRSAEQMLHELRNK